MSGSEEKAELISTDWYQSYLEANDVGLVLQPYAGPGLYPSLRITRSMNGWQGYAQGRVLALTNRPFGHFAERKFAFMDISDFHGRIDWSFGVSRVLFDLSLICRSSSVDNYIDRRSYSFARESDATKGITSAEID